MASILLVEDDDQLRGELKKLLINSGYEVWEAPNGKGVCEMYRQNRFDLVITELVMPEKEGMELITDLRRLDKNARIIAMAGAEAGRELAYFRIARKLGAQHTLSRPFALPEFLRVVSLALESEAHNSPP